MNIRLGNLGPFAVLDLLCLNMIHFVLMLILRSVPGSKEYFYLFLLENGIWIICGYAMALYIQEDNSEDNFFKSSLVSFFLFWGVTLLYVFLSRYSYSRLFVILTFTCFGTGIIISRTLYLGANYYLKKQYPQKKKIIFIGYNELSRDLLACFSNNKFRTILGYFEDEEPITGNNNTKYPVIGKIDYSVKFAIQNNVSEIYSTISPEQSVRIYRLAQEAEENFIRFKFVPNLKMFVNRKVYVDFARNIPILSLHPEPLEDLHCQIEKRLFDVGFSLIVILFIMSWMVPLLATLIKLESRGSVFYTHLRSGKNNRPFICYKFRSLRVNKAANVEQLAKDNKSITRIGRFLQKTNLDELPQFINVLLGDMSVVGPRPYSIKHTEEYAKMLSRYMVRQYVKPGVTGWAQINGYRGEITNQRNLSGRIEHDIWYMENWSMWLDFKIILLTILRTYKKNIKGYKQQEEANVLNRKSFFSPH